MKRIRISLAFLALLFSVGAAVAQIGLRHTLNTNCWTGMNQTGTNIGTDACPSGSAVNCCYLADNTLIKKART